MTRLVPRRALRESSTDVDGAGVWRVLARLGACSQLVVCSRPRPTRLPSGTLVPLLDAVFSKGRVFCVFLGSKAGVWRPCRGGIFQRA